MRVGVRVRKETTRHRGAGRELVFFYFATEWVQKKKMAPGESSTSSFGLKCVTHVSPQPVCATHPQTARGAESGGCRQNRGHTRLDLVAGIGADSNHACESVGAEHCDSGVIVGRGGGAVTGCATYGEKGSERDIRKTRNEF